MLHMRGFRLVAAAWLACHFGVKLPVDSMGHGEPFLKQIAALGSSMSTQTALPKSIGWYLLMGTVILVCRAGFENGF